VPLNVFLSQTYNKGIKDGAARRAKKTRGAGAGAGSGEALREATAMLDQIVLFALNRATGPPPLHDRQLKVPPHPDPGPAF
jgi:hypothetical protein